MYYGRNYFSSKNFKSVKNDETVIVGDTAKHIWDARKHKNIAKLKYEDSIMCVKPKIFGKTVGYIEVGENEYIRVKKHGSTLMIALLLLLSSIFLIGGNVFKDDVKPIIGVGQDIEDYPGSSKGNVEYINVPGLRAEYLLTESNKDVYLVNPEGNSVYFKYTLYNNDEVIYETEYIKPGKMIKADLYSILDKGTYELKVHVASVDIETYNLCNGANLQTVVVIDK